ncbi:hypothetical protein V6N13_147469 [Hibiscus sabdariffa]
MTNRLMDPCLVEVHKKSPREVVGQNVESYLFEEQGSHLKNVDLVTSKAMEDIQCMGLQDVVGEFSNSLELTKGKSSWEANVDKQNNIHLAFGELDELREIPDTLEESRAETMKYDETLGLLQWFGRVHPVMKRVGWFLWMLRYTS